MHWTLGTAASRRGEISGSFPRPAFFRSDGSPPCYANANRWAPVFTYIMRLYMKSDSTSNDLGTESEIQNKMDTENRPQTSSRQKNLFTGCALIFLGLLCLLVNSIFLYHVLFDEDLIYMFITPF